MAHKAVCLRVKCAGGFIGGGQERGFRSGTTNAPGIMAMFEAAQHAVGHRKEHEAHMRSLKLLLAQGLMQLPAPFSTVVKTGGS